jgi:toxin ParE1/3/4
MAHRLSAEAETELDQIWWYIAQQSGSADRARRVVTSITERFNLLATNSYLGRSRDGLRRGLRSFPAGDYVVFYRIEGKDVVILHVIHGRRDIPSLIR